MVYRFQVFEDVVFCEIDGQLYSFIEIIGELKRRL